MHNNGAIVSLYFFIKNFYSGKKNQLLKEVGFFVKTCGKIRISAEDIL